MELSNNHRTMLIEESDIAPGMSKNTQVPQEHTSRYKFTEHTRTGKPPELCIGGKDRNTVIVSPTPTCLKVSYLSETGDWYTQRFGFFDYYALSQSIARGLMHFWQPPADRPNWSGVYQWAYEQTEWSIGKRLYTYYKRCLAESDPTILALQRSVFAATFSVPEIVFESGLYKGGYVVQDVIQYRAAAVALANLHLLRSLKLRRAKEKVKTIVQTSGELQLLKEFVEDMGGDLSIDMSPKGYSYRIEVDEALEMMGNWRGLFSPTGEPYRSLDRTLMNLPGGVPATLVPYLSQIYLHRPVLSRSELIVLTLHQKIQLDRLPSRLNERVFQNASNERIARAMKLVAEHTRNPLSIRRAMHLRFLVRFLMDYPDEHEGNIVGLTEKCIRWHRWEQKREIEQTLSKLGGDRPTEKPPIPPPENPNISLLSSVMEVCQEGMRMNNCVASYAQRAVQGSCYLFHVIHEGEEATIEVDQSGCVAQATGPANRENVASKWGKRTLNRWGKGFPKGHNLSHCDLTELNCEFLDC